MATSARADWGLLRDVARQLDARADVELSVIATNMHLDPAFGLTVNEIEADGVAVAARVPMNHPDPAQATAMCLSGMAEAFARIKPDLLVLLGDRYEMLAVATAATIMRIPIVHIAGGEISEGAFDDSIRHALTKLSALHLTATEPYRRRVIQMGEHPDRVINTGAIGVYNLAHDEPMSREELEASVGLPIDRRTLLVTLHPATLDEVSARERARQMLAAIDRFPSSTVIITYPNNDPEGREIIEEIEAYGQRNPQRVKVIPSLGRHRYLSALHYVGAVVGNSSSGIVEVPSMGIPTVDIGIRQQGRLASDSVIHCAADTDSIASAIECALSPEGKRLAETSANPYGQPDTLATMVRAIAETPLETLRTKRFHDLPLPTNL